MLLDNIPIHYQLSILALLLLTSAIFSVAETSLMSVNRYRLRHLVKEGNRGARLASYLLARTDQLLGVILMGNTLAIAAASALSTIVTVNLFGEGEWMLAISTLSISFLILVFGEISPKVIAANNPEKWALLTSYFLYPLLKLLYPVVWFINLLVSAFLRIFGIRPSFSEHGHAVSIEELRTIITEAGSYIPKKHRAILLNLFELETITVDDVMIAHTQVEVIDFDAPFEVIMQQISKSHHTRLPVRQGANEEIIGVIHIRKVINQLRNGEIEMESLKEIIEAPYFIPSGTSLYAQMQHFQEQSARMALVVDEYGELKGLVTLEDILEEVIGDFTTQSPLRSGQYRLEASGSWLVDGSANLRELNKKLGLSLPVDGPRTLNGLILEHFEDIPEANTSLRIANITLEILQTQDKVVKSVRIYL